MSTPRLAVAAATTGLAALLLAVPGHAQRGGYSFRTVTEVANPGLAVTGPLSDNVATSRARVLVPDSWRRLRATGGRLRFRNTQNPSCRFTITYSVRSRLTPPQNATDYVQASLPAASSAYLLDRGERGNSAYRVVRQRTTGQVRVDALWVGVLTRRSDIVPVNLVAWTEIRATGVSTAGSECHSGTYRQALGPTLGDSLAVARNSLRFTRR